MVDDALPQVRCDFYVYILFRPGGSPCYVGKGRGKRDAWHFKNPAEHYNRKLAEIIVDAGGALPAIRAREHLTETEAFQTEIALIEAIGRDWWGPLVNMTDGGEGHAGYTPSPEHRAKIRAAHKGRPKTPEWCAKVSAINKGQVVTPEHRAKISAAKTGAPLSPKQHAAYAARKGTKHTPEHRAKIGSAGRGRTHGPESRAKIGAALKGRSLSPERVAKMVERVVTTETRAKLSKAAVGNKLRLGATHTPETRAKMSLSRSGTTLSDEHRAKISAGLLAYRARQRAA